MTTKKLLKVRVEKVSTDLGIVFGYGIVCKENGEPYFDTDDQHTPEDEMLFASAAYMSGDRVAKDGHRGSAVGQCIFGFPMTEEIADSLDIVAKRHGFLVGMRPRSDLLEKFASGERTGFSMGGTCEDLEDV